jgi:hypothetical protein
VIINGILLQAQAYKLKNIITKKGALSKLFSSPYSSSMLIIKLFTIKYGFSSPSGF